MQVRGDFIYVDILNILSWAQLWQFWRSAVEGKKPLHSVLNIILSEERAALTIKNNEFFQAFHVHHLHAN